MISRRFIRFLCLSLAIGLTTHACPAFAQEQVGDPLRAANLGLMHMSEQIPQKVDNGQGSFSIWVTLGASRVQLELQPYSLRRASCEVIEEGPGGVRTKLVLPPAKTYRGTVQGEGDVKGVVAASLDGNAVRARILLDDGSDWYLQPIPGDAAGTHAVYRSTDAAPTTAGCASEPVTGESRQPLAAPDAQGSGCVEAEIGIEADYAYYQWNGSNSTQTINDIDAVMNAVELMYARDVKISYKVTQYLIQTTGGKYPSSDPGTRLVQFRDWWNANQGSVPRDVAHLMTAAAMNNNLIGIAYYSVICNTASAYGISNSPWSTLFSNRVGVTAHELGHNWGAMHCDGQTDCWVMCGNIGGCAADPTRFNLSSIREIETYRNLSGTCLASGTGTPTALNPTARDDRSVTAKGAAVTISVLTNDFDPNCQTITVGSYPSSTSHGGTVSASGDNLVYTPSASYIGEDSFTYTVRDAGGAQSTATVTVDVQDYRAADAVTGAVAGLQVRYYYVPPLDGSLGSMPTLSNPFRVETTQTLSFPSTTGLVGSSGLTDKVALRCTGKIKLPTADTYTFYLTSDDGAKLYIDGTLRVDNDGIHTVLERSASVALSAGLHDVRVDYYDATGPSMLRLELRSSTIARAEIAASMWSAGVQTAYYQLNSTVLPRFQGLVPEKTQFVTAVDYPFSWGAFAGSGRNLSVGAVFEGYMTVPSDGVYFFELTSEDGSRMYIGDKLVVDNDGVHNRVTMTGGAVLRAGAHKTRIEYFLREGGCALTASVWSSSLTKRVIPASWWTHLTTFHVPTDYASISSAISAATANSMVWVAAGTYVGTANKNLDLGNKSITLYGGGGPELTILDAENSGRVFRLVSHSQSAAVIEGFTISRGSITTGVGAGMDFESSTLQVRNCVIAGNSSSGNGAGVGLLGSSSPTFENCVISGNRAGGAGGGIHAESGTRPTFTGCTVAGNYAVTLGGGAHTVGGTLTFTRSIVWGNGAGTVAANDAWTADLTGTLSFACSDVRNATIGGLGTETFSSNSIFTDPRFCTPAAPTLAPTTAGAYSVTSSSPVLGAASPCGPMIGARGPSCNAAVTAVESFVSPGVSGTLLEQNVPNPFNPTTRISFTLLQGAPTTVRIYDAGGRLVRTLIDQDLPEGPQTVLWDGFDGRGRRVATGVYFYQLRSGAVVETRNMVLLK
jgi:parallel beta-helix repeat protein